MKPGDLVCLKEDAFQHWLYDGDQQCWDEFYCLIRHTNDVIFGTNDIGTILMMKKMKSIKNSYVKLLTQHGIGWIYEIHIKKIND
jgi:hypothetical protein